MYAGHSNLKLGPRTKGATGVPRVEKNLDQYSKYIYVRKFSFFQCTSLEGIHSSQEMAIEPPSSPPQLATTSALSDSLFIL